MILPHADAPRMNERELGRWWDVVALLWGLTESILFFIVPDVLFTFSATISPRRSLRHVALVILGAIIGGSCLFLWASSDPAQAWQIVSTVPFTTEAMFQRVESDYRQSGALAPLLGPFSGIPYKVYAVLAPGYLPLSVFVFVSVPARAERLLVSWAIFAVLGLGLRRWTANPLRWIVAAHGAYWIVVYAMYWTRSS